jgi:hypothetical protein
VIPTLGKSSSSRSNKRPPSVPRRRPSSTSPRREIYGPARIAEFLLNNSVTPKDYAAARREVTQLGIDPDTIEHEPLKKR